MWGRGKALDLYNLGKLKWSESIFKRLLQRQSICSSCIIFIKPRMMHFALMLFLSLSFSLSLSRRKKKRKLCCGKGIKGMPSKDPGKKEASASPIDGYLCFRCRWVGAEKDSAKS